MRFPIQRSASFLPIVGLAVLATPAGAQTRTPDVVYMRSGGAAFTMDVVRPDKPNRAAVIFMVSGGWMSDHSMLTTFMAGIEKAFTSAGFTVFEVVHGAQPRYRVSEIVDQVRTATRYVYDHRATYGIDADRIGVSGISSGAHLALMVAGMPGTPVKAVAAIAPPTDLVNWGKADAPLTDNPQLAMFAAALGVDPKSPNRSILRENSPIGLVEGKFPATLIVHGDADVVVPVQQAQTMDEALGKAGAEHRLDIVPGGGHDDKVFVAGLVKAVQWFREKLLR